MFLTVFNRTDRPAVIDRQGRVLGGGEWGTVSDTEPQAVAALSRGDLGMLQGDDPQLDAARDARDRTALLASRASQALDLSDDQRATAVHAAGLDGTAVVGDDLAYLLAVSGVNLGG